jgi:MoaA/NifB/PqqE/SkfB family radical SAM enzyme
MPKSPPLDWIQVEATSHCNAKCIYCPRTVYADKWLSRHMSLDTYSILEPAFAKTGLVYLQGWGEPLLHPGFFEMVCAAKKAGCKVGTTTNGMLVDDEMATKLVEHGIDIVAFSLAGSEEKNDTVRVGTRLRSVLKGMKALGRAKQELALTRPAIHVAYLLLRSGMDDLLVLPRLLEGMGVTQVVVSTLDFVPVCEMEKEALFPSDEMEFSTIRDHLEAAAAAGKTYGLNIHYYLPFKGKRQQRCLENVHHALFVSADGSVSPCAFTAIPTAQADYAVHGEERPYHRLTFGKVSEQSLPAIWRGKSYREFRKGFFSDHFYPSCWECPKLCVTHGGT